jgi:4-hydroxy-tetrahydrodipicolinate synthase
MHRLALHGVFTALVTPFTQDGKQVDWDAFERVLELQLAAGVEGLVPCGTTGETPTLSADEQRRLIERTAERARGRAVIMAGTGSNDTKKSVETSLSAVEAGAEAVMLANPYYNKPSQEGMFRHVREIARAVSVPVILYNIPGRTSVTLNVETVLRILDACPNVVAVKDATGNVLHCQDLLQRAGDRVVVMCGDDLLTLPMLSVGASGVVSVTSNLLPARVAEVVRLAREGRFDAARVKHLALLPVHRALFSEPSPQPVKAALALRGAINDSVRLPLVPASEKCRELISRVLDAYEAG